jgi:uncharacterized protein (TIGR02246 family)
MSDSERAIRDLYAANVAALEAGDVETLAELYTEGAIQLPPDRRPRVGRKAIRAALKRELQGTRVEATVEIEELVIMGLWAYVRGSYRTVVPSDTGKRGSVVEGSWLDILEWQDYGTWQILRSTWSVHPRRRSQAKRQR